MGPRKKRRWIYRHNLYVLRTRQVGLNDEAELGCILHSQQTLRQFLQLLHRTSWTEKETTAQTEGHKVVATREENSAQQTYVILT